MKNKILTCHNNTVETVKEWTKNCMELYRMASNAPNVFDDSSDSLDGDVDAISSCVLFCINNAVPSKQITMFPYNKPWVIRKLKAVLNRDSAWKWQVINEMKIRERI